MAYFYIKRVATTNQVASTYNNNGEIANGDYFLLSAQTTATENGIYLRNNNTNSKLADSQQPKVSGAAISLTAVSGASGQATATFAAQASVPFEIGSQIIVAGVTGQTGYNGTWTVTACTTTTVSWSSSLTVSGTVTSATVKSAADLILSVLDNAEYKRTATNTYTKSTTLSAASGIRAAIINATQGATKPLPLGASNFPEQIDLIKVLDYSTDTNASAALVNYYTALSNYYANPNAVNAESVRTQASAIQSYILTENDYNLLASAVMNIQLYLKQYLPSTLGAYQQTIQSFIDNSNDYYFGQTLSYATYVSPTTPPTKTIGGDDKKYLWFKEV